MLSGCLLCRPANREGTFDCEAVIQSVTILGLKKKPSAVNVRVSGAEGSSASFQYKEAWRVLTVTSLNLSAVMDWEIRTS